MAVDFDALDLVRSQNKSRLFDTRLKTLQQENSQVHELALQMLKELPDEKRWSFEERLKKIIRYSEPNKEKKTLFIWPEGVFSGYSYNEILIFKELFKKSFSKNHFIILGSNKLELTSGQYFNSMLVLDNNLEIIDNYQKIIQQKSFLMNVLIRFEAKIHVSKMQFVRTPIYILINICMKAIIHFKK